MALLKEIVPAEYHAAGYLKDLLDKPQDAETFGAVFKKLHNAETLVGKKTGVPAAEASDEDWDKFFTQLKPGSAEEYTVPKGKDGKDVDPDFAKALREAFLDGAINKRQAAKFMSKFQASMADYGAKQTAAQQQKQAKLDADFDTLAKSALGEQNKAVMARTRKLMEDNAPAALKAYIPQLDDKALVIMSGVINSIAEKYMSEDDLKTSTTTSGDGQSKRSEAQKLLGEISKMTGFEADYDAKRAKLKQLYKEASAEK